jgi:hypothetical protein
MKNTLWIAAAVFVLSIFAVFAGSADQEVLCNVPFAFNVGRKVLPAGQYEVRELSSSANEWAIRSENGKHEAVFVTEQSDVLNPPKSSELTFEDVGNQHYLSGIQIEGETEGWTVPLDDLNLAKLEHQTRHVLGSLRKRS